MKLPEVYNSVKDTVFGQVRRRVIRKKLETELEDSWHNAGHDAAMSAIVYRGLWMNEMKLDFIKSPANEDFAAFYLDDDDDDGDDDDNDDDDDADDADEREGSDSLEIVEGEVQISNLDDEVDEDMPEHNGIDSIDYFNEEFFEYTAEVIEDDIFHDKVDKAFIARFNIFLARSDDLFPSVRAEEPTGFKAKTPASLQQWTFPIRMSGDKVFFDTTGQELTELQQTVCLAHHRDFPISIHMDQRTSLDYGCCYTWPETGHSQVAAYWHADKEDWFLVKQPDVKVRDLPPAYFPIVRRVFLHMEFNKLAQEQIKEELGGLFDGSCKYWFLTAYGVPGAPLSQFEIVNKVNRVAHAIPLKEAIEKLREINPSITVSLEEPVNLDIVREQLLVAP